MYPNCCCADLRLKTACWTSSSELQQKSWRSGPGSVACERYYNAVLSDDGDLDTQSVEKRLSEVESDADPILVKLLEGGSLSPEERNKLALFITVQDYRSPRRRQEFADLALAIEHHGLSSTWPTSLEHYKEIVRTASQNRRRFDENRPRADSRIKIEENGTIVLAREDTVKCLNIAEHLAPVVANMDWTLLRAPEGKRFILSDSPVQVFEERSSLPEHTGPGYWRPNSKVSFPLTPSVCLVATHAGVRGIFRPKRLRWGDATSNDWRFLNDLQLGASYRQVYATQATDGLKRACAKLPEAQSELSFMPIAVDGSPVSVKLRRR
ncbi:DUF4238 domain-containing protein [Ensifer adhaerens]